MSEHENQQAHGSGRGPVVEDFSLRNVVLFAVGIVLLMVVATVAMYFITVELRDRDRAQDAPPSPIVREAAEAGIRQEPPAPRLQPQPGVSTGLVDRGIRPDRKTAPNVEMRRFLAEEEEELNSYGWVDEGHGIARVPIDRAMEILVEQGLPETPESSPADAGGEEGSDG
jgi:hypothetical protein